MRRYFLVLALVFSLTSYAQHHIYKHFGVDEGLPSSQVYDIYQDKEGYIWFATDKGLSRYNGYEFENFDTNNGLPGNVVLRFYPQENGEVWGYTFHNKALFYFNEIFDGFTSYKYNELIFNELDPNSIVKSLFVDEFNTVQLGGRHINGLLSITETGKISLKYDHKDFYLKENAPERYTVLNNSSKRKESYFITADKDIINSVFSLKRSTSSFVDVTMLIPNKKAVFMDGNSIKIVSNMTEENTIKSIHAALRVKTIDSSHFFVGYHFGGATILNDKGEIIQEFLKGKSVTNFLIDHEGGYWFNTLNSGVYYIKNPSTIIAQQSGRNTSFHINSLAKKNNELLVGYNNGDFATINENRVLELEKKISILNPSFVEYDSILDIIYVYKKNRLCQNNIPQDAVYVTKLSEPSFDGAVFASNPYGFYDIRKNKVSLFPYRVQDISLWKNDTLIGTPFGVFKKNKDSITVLSKESKLFGYRSDDIDVSKSGNSVYIATQGAGVVVYDKEIYNISTKNGLSSDIVNEIYVENDSIIWACTNKGLNRIVFNNNSFVVNSIDKNSGLLSNEVEDVEIINDTLWVGTKDGLCSMPKNILDTRQLDNIYLKLKEVKVNDVVYDFKEVPKLNYSENKISFLVQGISYAKKNDLEYQYRLKETDSEWSSTRNRNISFPNLTHGAYTFQVRVCVSGKCIKERKLEYRFIINPPFWRSGWFYIVCVFAFIGLLYVFFKIRVLTYNKDVIREFIRLLIKWLKRDEKYLEIKMNGERIKIQTNEILYIKSSGNYLDVISPTKTYTIRCKIGDFITSTPDALEYLRVHRSYIIRIEKVTGKSKKSVTIKEHVIPVGETYLPQLDKIQF